SRFFVSSRRRHTRFSRDWSSDVCSSDLAELVGALAEALGLLVEVVGSLGAGLAAQFEEAAQRLVQLALGFGALGSCGAAVAGGELARAALQLAHLAARLLGDPGEGAQALRQTGHAVGPQAAEGRALAEAEATRAVEVLHVTPEAL